MERSRGPFMDFVSYREDLKLPSLEDFRVYWHTQMLSAQRYMEVLDGNLSLARHLDYDLYASTLEANISKDFSTQRPQIVEDVRNPCLSWSDVIRETNDASFTEEGKGIFSCRVRGYKIQMSAQDRKQVSHYYSLSVVRQMPQPQDIRLERETISEVRDLIIKCKKDREEAAKFEQKLDDILMERDYQLREFERSLMSPRRSESYPHNVSSEPTKLSSEHPLETIPSPQLSRVSEAPQVFEAPVPRWSPEMSSVDSVMFIDRDDFQQHIPAPRQPLSDITAPRRPLSEIPNTSETSAPSFTSSFVADPYSLLASGIATSELSPRSEHTPQTPRSRNLMTPDEKLHNIRFTQFLLDRGVPWPELPGHYEWRFKVPRSAGTLKFHYYSAPRETRVSHGCVAFAFKGKPRLKKLVDRLWRE